MIHRKRPIFAFTLIELLVVIGIVVILVSILLPVLGRVRHSARTAACLSNVGQLDTAFRAYVQNNNDETMLYSHNSGLYWHQLLTPYLGESAFTFQPNSGQQPTVAVMFCPEAALLANGTTDAMSGNLGVFGDSTTAWHWFSGGGAGSYGMNLWLFPNDPIYRGTNTPPGYMTPNRYFLKLTDAGPNVPVLGDSNWVGSWPDNSDLVPPDLRVGFGPHAQGYFMGRFCIARHDQAINLAFADGSARLITLGELWQLQWNHASVPRAVFVQ